MPQQHFDVIVLGSSTVVRFRLRSLVGLPAEALADGLTLLADGRHLRLDFSHVECLSAAALGGLLRLRKRVQAAGGTLALEGLSALLRTVFEVTRLSRVFGLRPARPRAPRLPEEWRLLGRPHLFHPAAGLPAAL
jgi:anti-anti-sigma factor